MYGAVLTPSVDADFDVFFLHNEGYSTMCGHAIIALTKLAIETGLVRKPTAELEINVPAGRIQARAELRDGKVVQRPRSATCLVSVSARSDACRCRSSARCVSTWPMAARSMPSSTPDRSGCR